MSREIQTSAFFKTNLSLCRYQSFIEEHVEKRLIAMVPGFSMEDFLGQLEERHEVQTVLNK